MKYVIQAEDTICAICSPIGVGSIAVIRVSGPDAFRIVKKMFKAKNGKKFSNLELGRVYLGEIVDSHKVIDESICIFFKSPKSFTGEDVVEIHTHGGTFVPNAVLKVLVNHGCRIASPGEFSFRSYQNGKIDLLKAESIASLIASQTEMGANLSIKNLSGEISKKFNDIRNLAITLLAEIEARVDFPEDQIPELDKKRISLLYEELISDSERILSTYSKGRLAFSGTRVTILGKPNAGKSTLLNVLLEEDRAIVSPNPGTTRDILEADIVHNGRRIIFYDTAGLRSTKGKVEAEGVRRAKDKAEFSDVVIILVEKKDLFKNQNIIDEFFNFVPRGKRFIVASKSDLFDIDIRLPLNTHVISSKTRSGINSLLDKICEFSNVDIESDFAEGVLTTERQVALLNEGLVSLRASQGLFEDDAYFEIVSIEIREFINSISDITGEVSNNDIYDKLFSSFCIGK